LGILAKNGAHENIGSPMELNFIRENTCKKATVSVSRNISKSTFVASYKAYI